MRSTKHRLLLDLFAFEHFGPLAVLVEIHMVTQLNDVLKRYINKIVSIEVGGF